MKDRLIELLNKVQECGMDRPTDDERYPTLYPSNEEIADYLLANGVIVPPVWVGKMVYYYCPDLGGIFPYFVENVNIGFLDKDRNYWTYEANCHDEETDEFLDEIDFDLDDIGKTVFLTREEAEKALAEREGGE